ncbi:MAG: HD domain-containing protein [Candidatus Levybacteria bacterium]|nr:HD domain-containing protein [Candidatus Levybacteria bacterium]
MRLEKVKKEVEALYTYQHPNADQWNVWAYLNHVQVVAKNAERIAQEQNANIEHCVSGALLHDIADAVMTRFSKGHEKESLRIANEILEKSGYTDQERNFIVNEIIAPHSCSHTIPTALEGKVLATADAMAHFQTDFFLYFAWQHLGGKDLSELKKWVLIKIEKHFNKKIFFEEYRKEVEPKYKAIKLLFSK